MTDSDRPPRTGRIQGAGGVGLRTLFWPTPEARGGVVIVHGLGEHVGRYHHVALALNAVGLDVYGYDHRGHGDSKGARGHFDRFEDMLTDLDRAFEDADRQLAPGPRFLLAHSMGGLIGLAWIQTRQPEIAGAVVSAPWLATAVQVPGWKRWAGALADRLVPRLAMDTGNRPHHVTSDPEMIAALEADPLSHTRMSARAFAEVQRWQSQVRSAADQVKTETLFVVPGADPLADARATRELAHRLPPEHTATLELPGFLHESLNERNRQRVIDAICAWLSARMVPGADGSG